MQAARLRRGNGLWAGWLGDGLAGVARKAGRWATGLRRHAFRTSFEGRPDDIFVVGYPRSGSTMLVMLLYQLTTDGTVDFPHISQRCPWFERLAGSSSARIRELASPRVFKSHLRYRDLAPLPGRFIYIVRDVRDVAVSYYHHYRRLLGFAGSFEEFLRAFVTGHVQYGPWSTHVAEWHRNPCRKPLLLVRYRELVAAPAATARDIAGFLGLGLGDEAMHRVAERCSFEFMKQNEARFDHCTEVLLELGVTPGGHVRRGSAGGWRTEPEAELLAVLERLWPAEVPKESRDGF